MFLKTLMITALTAGLSFAQASAEPQSITRSQMVSFADLDLSAAEDRKALDRRLRAAARSVCGDPEGRTLRDIVLVRRCRDEAMAAAHREMVTRFTPQFASLTQSARQAGDR